MPLDTRHDRKNIELGELAVPLILHRTSLCHPTTLKKNVEKGNGTGLNVGHRLETANQETAVVAEEKVGEMGEEAEVGGEVEMGGIVGTGEQSSPRRNKPGNRITGGSSRKNRDRYYGTFNNDPPPKKQKKNPKKPHK